MRNSQESADFRARKILVKKLFKNLKKNYWYLFILQRGKSWGGGYDKHRSVASHMNPNWSMYFDWELSSPLFGVQDASPARTLVKLLT